ncbi:Golgi to ER traffic- protein [Puccinia graminis f. sp. tritici]|uniref:Golgi to ER traffic-protein n=1 Tax=Puccinia graminis f. sp. tritici TaxID=56615 RepID=A0A5B0PGD9_PUCGR|nr:Golgi to ER traffic- protein [Puccinia graminis f. sp. tritici]
MSKSFQNNPFKNQTPQAEMMLKNPVVPLGTEPETPAPDIQPATTTWTLRMRRRPLEEVEYIHSAVSARKQALIQDHFELFLKTPHLDEIHEEYIKSLDIFLERVSAIMKETLAAGNRFIYDSLDLPQSRFPKQLFHHTEQSTPLAKPNTIEGPSTQNVLTPLSPVAPRNLILHMSKSESSQPTLLSVPALELSQRIAVEVPKSDPPSKTQEPSHLDPLPVKATDLMESEMTPPNHLENVLTEENLAATQTSDTSASSEHVPVTDPTFDPPALLKKSSAANSTSDEPAPIGSNSDTPAPNKNVLVTDPAFDPPAPLKEFSATNPMSEEPASLDSTSDTSASSEDVPVTDPTFDPPSLLKKFSAANSTSDEPAPLENATNPELEPKCLEYQPDQNPILDPLGGIPNAEASNQSNTPQSTAEIRKDDLPPFTYLSGSPQPTEPHPWSQQRHISTSPDRTPFNSPLPYDTPHQSKHATVDSLEPQTVNPLEIFFPEKNHSFPPVDEIPLGDDTSNPSNTSKSLSPRVRQSKGAAENTSQTLDVVVDPLIHSKTQKTSTFRSENMLSNKQLISRKKRRAKDTSEDHTQQASGKRPRNLREESVDDPQDDEEELVDDQQDHEKELVDNQPDDEETTNYGSPVDIKKLILPSCLNIHPEYATAINDLSQARPQPASHFYNLLPIIMRALKANQNPHLDNSSNDCSLVPDSPKWLTYMEELQDKKQLARILASCPRLLQLPYPHPFLNPSLVKMDYLTKPIDQNLGQSRSGSWATLNQMMCRSTETGPMNKYNFQKILSSGLIRLQKTIKDSLQHIDPYDNNCGNLNEKYTKQERETKGLGFAEDWLITKVRFLQLNEDPRKSQATPTQSDGLGFIIKRVWEMLLAISLIYDGRDTCVRMLQLMKSGKQMSEIKNLDGDAGVRKTSFKGNATVEFTPDDWYTFRLKAYSSLTVFLLFGVAGWFHCQNDRRRFNIRDLYSMYALVHQMSLKKATITSKITRSLNNVDSESINPGWERMNQHIVNLLVKSGVGERTLDWFSGLEMWKKQLNPSVLAPLIIKDFFSEVLDPGLTLSSTGSEAPQNIDHQKVLENWQARIPEIFCPPQTAIEKRTLRLHKLGLITVDNSGQDEGCEGRTNEPAEDYTEDIAQLIKDHCNPNPVVIQ